MMDNGFRFGTPPAAMHALHGRAVENGAFQSAWEIEGQPLPVISIDGHNWFSRDAEAPLRGELLLKRAVLRGTEGWRPLDPETFAPIGWKIRPKRGAEPLRDKHGATRAWLCVVCESSFPSSHRDIADRCCIPPRCEWSAGCEELVSRGHLYCGAHEAATKREAERIAFEAAEKVPADAYGGWVFSEVDPTHQGDGYYPSVAHLVEHCLDRDLAVPAYAWACEAMKPSSDAESIVEQALEEHHEDAASEVNSAHVRMLQFFLDAFWRDVGITSWRKDEERVVMLAPRGDEIAAPKVDLLTALREFNALRASLGHKDSDPNDGFLDMIRELVETLKKRPSEEPKEAP